ncbi:Anaerobic nitric oxide reductase transcription regulator NorR [bioreactor metagenome]|uniref:Anaerobic nitric oxide reductase transcription regulator NorR n=1 Tax=bioreactor metagenome TaxID=1076179 RepID=A0A644YMW5_9ZZZZ
MLKDLQRSVQLLEESGSGNQLAETYVECACIFNSLGDREMTKKYAQLAWSSFTTEARKGFPRNLNGFVDTNDYSVDLSVLLETAWLEFRHIINPERLVARLLTSICRQLKTESAAFLLIREGKYHPFLLQNIEREKELPQYQRMLAIAVHVEESREIFTVQDKQLALRQQTLDLKMNPRFILCIPFFNGEKVGAVLYLESYYKADALTASECKLLMSFSRRLSEHLFLTLDYESFQEIGGKVESGEQASSRISESGSYCPSIDEKILLIQAQIKKIAKTRVPILITGETGVGKELFCEEIYEQSSCKGAFVKVNCGAIPESLIESELFGYERGSFTGAVQQKKGYFEMAEGGTIFLDEIGELTLQTQVKLLRVLQEHELLRVGGTKAVKVEFRLIAATNKDLKEEVEKGTFRKDLYYRLNVMQISIPPLRERKADIANMARFFVDKFSRELGRIPCQISSKTLVSLLEYDWPGNVRELENTMQRAVLLSEGDYITLPQFSPREKNAAVRPETLIPLAEMERNYISKVLSACNGKIAGAGGAAEILGLKRSTLISKMEKLGIKNINYYNL